MSKKNIVRLGIIGAGGMAGQHAQYFGSNPGCRVDAVADIDFQKAKNFANRYNISKVYSESEKILKSESIDAVALVVPDQLHAPLSIQCFQEAKHVFCEKPLATSEKEALSMCSAADQSNCIHMINFSYRNMPCLHAISKIISSGAIGEIRHVSGSYLQSWLTATIDGGWKASPSLLWRLSSVHGSKGVLGDIGVHLLDFVTFVAGPIESVYCKLKTFPKVSENRIGEYYLDANDSAVVSVDFKNGALGSIHTSRWAAGCGNKISLKIYGTEGAVEIDNELGNSCYRICSGKNLHKQIWITKQAPPILTTYEKFICAVQNNKQDQPDFHRGAEVQKMLDSCFLSDEKGASVKIN